MLSDRLKLTMDKCTYHMHFKPPLEQESIKKGYKQINDRRNTLKWNFGTGSNP